MGINKLASGKCISKITVVDSNDKNRGNVDCTCHQPVIYDVTVNNCYL